MKIPDADWYSCILGPDQIARNPVFVVKDRKAISIGEAIRKTIQLAIDISRPRRIKRTNLELRKKAKSDFLRSNQRNFFTGTDAIRKWAAEIDKLTAPTHNFGIILANDTTLGTQMSRMYDAANYLAWAAGQFQGETRKHIDAAQELFSKAAQFLEGGNQLGELCRWTCELYTEEDLHKEITSKPSLVYIVDEDKRPLLGDFADRSQNCPWGISVLPDQKTFDIAKRNAVANLTKIALLKEKAIAELEKALTTANR